VVLSTGGVFVLGLVVYLSTMTMEVGTGDGAEFALQAYLLGNTHPPGYPLHSLLGRFLMVFFHDPALSTTFLSVVSTAAAAAVMHVLLWSFTRNKLVSLCVPLLLAFSPKIWNMAVITEIYNVSMCMTGLAVLFVILWGKSEGRDVWLWSAAIVYGLSLGVSLSNALLLPVFVAFIIMTRRRVLRDSVLFLTVSGCLEVMFIAWIVARTAIEPPYGTLYVPNTLKNLLLYLSGSQYDTLNFEFRFFLERLLFHSKLLSRNLLFLGVPLGLFGLYRLVVTDRKSGIFIVFIMLINFLYFTNFRSLEFPSMVTITYFFFFLGIGIGLAHIYRFRGNISKTVVIVTLMFFLGVYFQTLFPKLRAQHRARTVTEFVHDSFRIFPAGSLIIAPWGMFNSLVYFQRVHGERPDLVIIEKSAEPRQYVFGDVASYQSFIETHITVRPVFCFRVGRELRSKYSFRKLDKRWFEILPYAPQDDKDARSELESKGSDELDYIMDKIVLQ